MLAEIENRHKPAVCPYTNKVIRITDLLGSQNLFQIEHIVPWSVSLDDSFMNKTLSESNFNRLKGERTPYEFYQQNSDPELWNADSWDEIERRAYSLLPYPKAKRFTMKKRPDDQEFISRQLNDTRYIGIKAASILSQICDDVMVMPGQMTAELRRLWGLNNIIQPVIPLNLDGYKVDEVKSLPHYVILDQDGVPKEIIQKLADRPAIIENQLLMPGWYDGKKNFAPELKYQQLKLEIDANNLPKGRYWAKLKVSDPVKFTRIFTERPDRGADSIAYRGRVENGKFSNESIKRKIDTDVPDGVYWGVFRVKKTVLIEPEKGKQPNTAGNQVLLYGEVKDNVFSSYIYTCETNIEPGRYWAVLDLDFESAEFTKAINPSGSESGMLYLDGTVDEQGSFAADCDPEYVVQTGLGQGKYYAIVSLEAIESCHPVENPQPELKKGESLIEGNIWVNRQTGEIMFDPKKNRDDQRHHAIDAIAVALTDRGYLNKLSHYFGELKERERGVGDRPEYDPPWEGFANDVKEAADNILVSYSRNNRVLNKISKTIIKSGKKFKSVGYAARGRLHREYYFGRHPNPIPNLKGSGNGLKFETGKDGEPVYYYHIRKPVTSIENHKHVDKIVDQGIRELIHRRLRDKFNIDPTGAYKVPDNFFHDENKKPALFLSNKNGDPVPVRKVRMREFIGKAAQLKEGKNQWVNPYNNHHVVIYETDSGEMQEDVVSFWDVIERVHQGESMFKLPEDGVRIITTLQENDMFLLGLSEELKESVKAGQLSASELSQYLYRVQKISSLYYTFRHHLASTVTNEKEELRIQSMKALNEYNPVKVKIGITGSLQMI